MKVFILRFLLKNLRRDGFKGFAVPALSLVLVMLIGVIGNLHNKQLENLYDILDNYEVRVELSDSFNGKTENLFISGKYFRMFTDDNNALSLSKYLTDIQLRRSLRILEIINLSDVRFLELTGITSSAADGRLDKNMGMFIEFMEGYDESILRSNEAVCIVNVNIYKLLDPDKPILSMRVQSFDHEAFPLEIQLTVVGIIHGEIIDVFSPFLFVSELAHRSDNQPGYSTIMNARLSDNRNLNDFRNAASGHFTEYGTWTEEIWFSLVIFDSLFNRVVRQQELNIMLVDVTAFLLYIISSAASFTAGYLITQRYKLIHGLMRCIGVRKSDILVPALVEQFSLYIVGVIAGSIFCFAFFNRFSLLMPMLYAGGYILGSLLYLVRTIMISTIAILTEGE